MPVLGEVDNRETSKTESYARRMVGPYTCIVGSAMMQRIRHAAGDTGQIFIPRLTRPPKSSYSAHRRFIQSVTRIRVARRTGGSGCMKQGGDRSQQSL